MHALDEQTCRDDDTELVLRTLAGDSQATGALFTKYYDRLFNAALRMCNHFADAEDLVQETILKAYASLSTFRGQSAFYTWLFSILRNSFASQLRCMKVRNLDFLTDNVIDPRRTDSERMEHEEEMRTAVRLVLEGIEPIEKSILQYLYCEGMSYEEAAEQLQISIPAVRAQSFGARKKARELLAQRNTYPARPYHGSRSLDVKV